MNLEQIVNSPYKNNTLYLPKEKKWINPKVAKVMTVDNIRLSIPLDKLNTKEVIEKYGKLTKLSLQDPVSNSLWDYIHIIDKSVFTPAANAYKISQQNVKGTRLSPVYCPFIPGTTQYKDYWREEYKRILFGYEPIVDGEPCGIRIPGEFYFYLNYCMVTNLSSDGKDLLTFPDFLLMDYYYFKELEARENPTSVGLPIDYKSSIAVAKSRRKGFSFKAAAGALWITAFSTKDRPKIIIASATGYDATLCFKKAMVMLDFLSTNTPFGRQDIGNPADNGNWKHIPVSMTDDSGHYVFGIENTRTKERRGRLSEISTVSLAQKSDGIAGEGIQRIFFEEAGKIGRLKEAWTFSRESLKVGSMWRGIAVIFGTGGEMQKDDGAKGTSGDFADLFNNPVAADLAAYDNIYEYQDNKSKCGWFISDLLFNPVTKGKEIVIDGIHYTTIDENGNPVIWAAELTLNRDRIKIKSEGKKKDYEDFLTQRCKTPSEAFLISEGTLFPVGDLWARKSQIEMTKLSYNAFRTVGELIEIGGKIVFQPDLQGRFYPIDTYPIDDTTDKEGCLLRYEAPMSINGIIPEGAYIISVDPIGQNTSSGKSLTSIIVMKTPKYAHQFGNECIVATYRGRNSLNPQGYVHELLIKLSKYYNAKITYENDRDGGIFQYFVRTGNIGRLLPKPILTMSKYLPNSKTLLREYGHSMATDRHKRIGEDLLLEWLLKRHPKRKGLNEYGDIEEVEGYRNLDILEDRAIIEELIAYNRTGNFDMVMALMGAIIQFNEYYNDDALKERIEQSDISDFWYELYLNKWGTDKSKQEYINRNKTNDIEYDNI